jgi:hypothetical protein
LLEAKTNLLNPFSESSKDEAKDLFGMLWERFFIADPVVPGEDISLENGLD